MQEIIEELTGYFKVIETFSKDMGQDGEALHEYLITLSNYMARANFLMAEFKLQWNDAKKQAYLNLSGSSEAQKKYYSISLAKDFINAKCGEFEHRYDLAERLSRLCTHTCDCIRTILSDLRSERQFSQYQS